jgi:phosphonate transport system substrate-binding protein
MKLQGMPAALNTEVVWRSPEHAFPPIVVPAGAGHIQVAALRETLIDMPNDETGRALLKALNLDGFMVGNPAMFDSIRQLARSVPGSGVPA